jgi:predicted MPP superfamily phosphohydrolase
MDSIGFIVDRAKLEAKKNIPANLEIVSLWDNDKKRVKEFLVRVDLIDSQKKVLISSELPVARPNNKHISSEARSVTKRMSINLLPLTTAGQYLFKVSQT